VRRVIRDFRRQKRRNRSRCHRTKVSGRDRQELAPFDNAREEHECNARRIVSPSRSDPAFDVTRKLLAEEEVLGAQLRTGPDHEPQQAQQVSEKGERCSEHVG